MNNDWYIGNYGNTLVKGHIILTKVLKTNEYRVAGHQTKEQLKEGKQMCQMLNNLKNG